MPYPEEIVASMAEKYKLSEIQKQQLQEVLLIEEIHPGIVGKTFDPENLLIHLETVVAPAAGGAGATTGSSEAYTSVLSVIAAKQVVADPASLEALRKVAADNSDAFREWDILRAEIQSIHYLKRSENRLKYTLTQEAYPKVLRLLRDRGIPLLLNSTLNRDITFFTESLSPYLNALVEPIHESATLYFRGLFERMGRVIPPGGIAFTNKNDGVQLGAIMTITYREVGSGEEKKIRYYIKTHQHESTSKVGTVKPPDPKELFVYRLLEHIGYGPKTYFFFNPMSPGGFYIATQDLGFTKVPKKPKSFVLFQSMIDTYNANPRAAEHDPMRREFIAFDIISRILRLTDITTNPGNLGCVVTGGSEKSKWKLFDFRVRDFEDGYLNEKIVASFMAGNSSYNYAYSSFLEYIFKSPEYKSKKIEVANQIMKELLSEGKLRLDGTGRKMTLPEAMVKAQSEVLAYIEDNHEKLGINLKTAKPDLDEYYKGINANLELLAAGILEGHRMYSEGVVLSASGDAAAAGGAGAVARPGF